MASKQISGLCAKGLAGKDRRHHPGRLLTQHQEEVQLLLHSGTEENMIGIKAVVCWYRLLNLITRASYVHLFSTPHSIRVISVALNQPWLKYFTTEISRPSINTFSFFIFTEISLLNIYHYRTHPGELMEHLLVLP